MNIIPEKKYGKIGCINNMDVLIKFKINSSLYKKDNSKKIINIIFDNSISSIGDKFITLKNGLKKFIVLVPYDYTVGIYSNDRDTYFGLNIITDIFKSINKIKCHGFNNYQKYIDLKLENAILFTDETLESSDFLKVINIDKCLDTLYLNNIINEIKYNIEHAVLKLYPINNTFIKKIYNNEDSNKIIFKNISKNKEYNILVNIDFLSLESIEKDFLDARLTINNNIIIENKLRIGFVKENNLINNEVLIQKILNQGNLLEKNIKKMYQDKNLYQIKNILYKLKEIYDFGKNPLLSEKYQKVVDCILYLEEEINSESLKSIELNYEMKYSHFDLNI